MNENQQNLQASILDRLIDLEPGVSREPVQYRLLTIGRAKASVVRDLENLLNTKRSVLAPPAAFREVNNSLFVYGLPDFTSQNPRSPMVRQQLRQQMERIISRFEPRLRNVKVNVEMSAQTERNLRFKISALLVVDPLTEPVTFDTYFDVSRGEYFISQ
ncbi:MAG: type VI secretion system baseplate subunit TssE [Deltaproteobacteria bacterium]|nr:type VI secretion system baseplate subunit TssE [Deltaproteobacteria bacterium]